MNQLMIDDIVIGAVSKIPTEKDLESVYKIIEESVHEYRHVDLLCFGELFLLNDPKFLDDAQNQDQLERIIYRIHDLAIKYNMAISYGSVIKEDKKLYIGQRIALPNQKEYTYRKVHLGKNERNSYGQGGTIDVFNFKGCTFGVQICIDTHIMEMSIMHKLMGAQIIIAPFNTPYDSQKRLDNWKKYIPARAYECNMCFVCTNYYGGVLMVNGNGLIVKECTNTDSVETYTFSVEKDFNKKIDYFSYRNNELYKTIFTAK